MKAGLDSVRSLMMVRNPAAEIKCGPRSVSKQTRPELLRALEKESLSFQQGPWIQNSSHKRKNISLFQGKNKAAQKRMQAQQTVDFPLAISELL